eukprot:2691849-Amphidinium_carterae.1
MIGNAYVRLAVEGGLETPETDCIGGAVPLVAILLPHAPQVSYLLCVVREELDVHITPLTPQLIVKSADTQITIPWDETSPVCDVREQSGDLLCR